MGGRAIRYIGLGLLAAGCSSPAAVRDAGELPPIDQPDATAFDAGGTIGADSGVDGALPCGDQAVVLEQVGLPEELRAYQLERVLTAAHDSNLIVAYETSAVEDGAQVREWRVGTVPSQSEPALVPAPLRLTAEMVHPFAVLGSVGAAAWISQRELAISTGSEISALSAFHQHPLPDDVVGGGPVCTGRSSVFVRSCDPVTRAVGVRLGTWDAGGADLAWSASVLVPGASCDSAVPTECAVDSSGVVALTQIGARGQIALTRWRDDGSPLTTADGLLGRRGTTVSAGFGINRDLSVAFVLDSQPSVSAYDLRMTEPVLLASVAVPNLDLSGALRYRGAVPLRAGGWMILYSYETIALLAGVAWTPDHGFGEPQLVTNEFCLRSGGQAAVTADATYFLCNTAHELYVIRMCRGGS